MSSAGKSFGELRRVLLEYGVMNLEFRLSRDYA